VIIWLLQVYWIYATAIFILATAGLIFSVVQTRRNNHNLERMARQHAQVIVVRGDHKAMIDSKVCTGVFVGEGGVYLKLRWQELMPGDLVGLGEMSNHMLTCDMVLLSGECVVNESSLTGESVPVIKSALPAAEPSGTICFACFARWPLTPPAVVRSDL
jgi:cation-transporting ATPase 13A2